MLRPQTHEGEGEDRLRPLGESAQVVEPLARIDRVRYAGTRGGIRQETRAGADESREECGGRERVLRRSGHGKGQRDRGVEDEVEHDVEKSPTGRGRAEAGECAIDTIQKSVDEDHDQGSLGLAGHDQRRRRHADEPACNCDSVRADSPPMERCRDGAVRTCEYRQEMTIKHDLQAV